MNSLQRAVLIVGIFLFVVLANVFAQTDIPRNGACFYRDTEYRGSFFCTPAGQSMENLPVGFNDAIQSVRVFGDAQVTVFNDSRFEGANTSFRRDTPNLHDLRLATDASRNWSKRISSLRVDDHGTYQDYSWNYTWGQGQTTDEVGACFFDQPNFRGRSFCVDRQRALNSLPSGFNDRIQSIRILGDSEVQIFNDINFSGAAARSSRDVADLHSWSIPDDPSKNWSGRISSLRVEAPRRGRWNTIGGYDRDDDAEILVRCSSQYGDSRRSCDSQGYVRNASMINSYGTCRKNINWGIDDGQLWVSDGCSADFEVHR